MIARLCLLCIAVIIGCLVVLQDLRAKRPKFVDPVIWRVPYTDGWPQLQPDI